MIDRSFYIDTIAITKKNQFYRVGLVSSGHDGKGNQIFFITRDKKSKFMDQAYREKYISEHEDSLYNNSCKVDLMDGHNYVNKFGCRNCHSINDFGPKGKNGIPPFIEVSALDSLQLTDFIFKSKHNGMYEINFKREGDELDDLNGCQKKAIVSYIESYKRSIPKTTF